MIKHIEKCTTAVIFSVSALNLDRRFLWLQDKGRGAECINGMIKFLLKLSMRASSFLAMLTPENMTVASEDLKAKELMGSIAVNANTFEVKKAAQFLDQLSAVNALNLVGLPEGITNFEDFIVYLKQKKCNNLK